MSNAEIFSSVGTHLNTPATRVGKPDPSGYTAEDREAYDQVPAWWKGDNGYFGALLQSPRFALNRAEISTEAPSGGGFSYVAT